MPAGERAVAEITRILRNAGRPRRFVEGKRPAPPGAAPLALLRSTSRTLVAGRARRPPRAATKGESGPYKSGGGSRTFGRKKAASGSGRKGADQPPLRPERRRTRTRFPAGGCRSKKARPPVLLSSALRKLSPAGQRWSFGTAGEDGMVKTGERTLNRAQSRRRRSKTRVQPVTTRTFERSDCSIAAYETSPSVLRYSVLCRIGFR